MKTLQFWLIWILIMFNFSAPSFALEKQKNLPNLSTKETIDVITSSIGIALSIVGTSFALVTLRRGVEQYRRDQEWKKAEFVAKEIKEFKADQFVKNVMLMLDWNQREIQLSQDGSVFVTDSLICKALQPNTYKDEKGGFTVEESLIRDHFDAFLDYLERFEAFIEAELVRKEDFDPYLTYWLNLIGNKSSNRKDLEFYETFWQYINYFGYSKFQTLMLRYGHDITPTKR